MKFINKIKFKKKNWDKGTIVKFFIIKKWIWIKEKCLFNKLQNKNWTKKTLNRIQ